MSNLSLRTVASTLVLASLAACSGMGGGSGMGMNMDKSRDADLRLTGDQEVPANDSKAVGTGHVVVGADGGVSGSVAAPTLQAMAAHIHVGAPGVNGPVIIPLTGSAGGVWSVPAGAKLTTEQLDAYKAGNLYVNIHTPEHKGGEIRTQLKP
jgi:hypothetical protein